MEGFLGSFAIGFLFIFPLAGTPMMLFELLTTKPEAWEWKLGETMGNVSASGAWISILFCSF